MESKDSKAQIEVWEWKEKTYEAIKDIPKGKRVEAIHEQTRETMEWLKKMKAEQKKAA